MALSDILTTARGLINGAGLGEKPSLRLTAASANITASGQTITFSLATGEGAKVKPGHVLSIMGSSGAADAFVVYVTSVNGDQVTGVAYDGSPTPSGTDLDAKVLEQNAMIHELDLHRAIDTVVSMLYPSIFSFATYTITPDLVSGQVELPSTVREVYEAWQVQGTEKYQIPAGVKRPVPTNISSTGVLGVFDFVDGSTCYVQAIEEVTTSTTDPGIQRLIALGAAALALSGGIVPSGKERASADAQDRSRPLQAAASTLWRDFVTLREQIAADLSQDTVRFMVTRG